MTAAIHRSTTLTSREHQILHMAADGLSNGEIGDRLHVTEDTVKTHVRRLFRKLGARNRAHAVHLGHVENLLCRRPANSTQGDQQPPAAAPAAQARATHVLRVVDLSNPQNATQTPVIARSLAEAETQMRQLAGTCPTNRRVLLYSAADLSRPIARMQGFRVL